VISLAAQNDEHAVVIQCVQDGDLLQGLDALFAKAISIITSSSTATGTTAVAISSPAALADDPQGIGCASRGTSILENHTRTVRRFQAAADVVCRPLVRSSMAAPTEIRETLAERVCITFANCTA
jgi:hypothetical protein